MTDGQSVSSPIPNPTSESGVFGGWLDGETAVNFPYAPTEDKTLTASFVRGRAEMEWETAGDWITDAYYDTPATYKKLNDLLTIMATCYTGPSSVRRYVMIGFSEDAIEVNNTTFITKGTIDYDGKTYYYLILQHDRHNFTNLIDKSVDIQYYFADERPVPQIVLDHYYYKD